MISEIISGLALLVSLGAYYKSHQANNREERRDHDQLAYRIFQDIVDHWTSADTIPTLMRNWQIYKKTGFTEMHFDSIFEDACIKRKGRKPNVKFSDILHRNITDHSEI